MARDVCQTNKTNKYLLKGQLNKSPMGTLIDSRFDYLVADPIHAPFVMSG